MHSGAKPRTAIVHKKNSVLISDTLSHDDSKGVSVSYDDTNHIIQAISGSFFSFLFQSVLSVNLNDYF